MTTPAGMLLATATAARTVSVARASQPAARPASAVPAEEKATFVPATVTKTDPRASGGAYSPRAARLRSRDDCQGGTVGGATNTAKDCVGGHDGWEPSFEQDDGDQWWCERGDEEHHPPVRLHPQGADGQGKSADQAAESESHRHPPAVAGGLLLTQAHPREQGGGDEEGPDPGEQRDPSQRGMTQHCGQPGAGRIW